MLSSNKSTEKTLSPKKKSVSTSDKAFTIALKKQVSDYFTSKNISIKGNRKLYVKSALLFTALAGMYFILLFVSVPAWMGILLCAMMGINLASIGFNVMHDGSHGSYSGKGWVNNLMAYSLNLMGGSAFFWKQKHNQIHHTYTNVEGLDDDIDLRPWIRTNTNQRRLWYHRYQHAYCLALYGFTYLLWVFVQDFRKYFTGKIGCTPVKKMNLREHFIFWGSKAIYLFIFIGLPVLQIGFWETLTGYLVISFVCGWVLSVVFQLAHVVEDTSFAVPDPNSIKLVKDWTRHQIATTANFSPESKIISWFTGGLNFQIEHHLFPKVSHIHYPAVSKIVKDACRGFNVRYIEYSTFFMALKSHVLYLKTVGIAP
ncbi:MAG: acyl-CoA desaturase [Bacteroidetes bacterium]|nr:acyl-CoA desaturase [Bacteroidota bacterium]